MRRQAPGIGFRIATFLIGGLAPLGVYFALHSRGVGDTEALALAWFVPVLWTVGSSIWRRNIDLLSVGGILAYGIAVAAAVFLGAGSLPLKLQRGFISGVVGIVCLVSVAIRRPVGVVLVRRVASGRGDEDFVDSDVAQRLGRLTLIVGAGCLGDAALHTALAILLPTATFLIASVVIHVVMVAGVLLSAYLVFRGRRRSSPGPPPGGGRRVAEAHVAADRTGRGRGALRSDARPPAPSDVKE